MRYPIFTSGDVLPATCPWLSAENIRTPAARTDTNVLCKFLKVFPPVLIVIRRNLLCALGVAYRSLWLTQTRFSIRLCRRAHRTAFRAKAHQRRSWSHGGCMQRLNRRFPVRLPETGEAHVQKRDIERVLDKGYEPFTADLLT